MKEVVAFLEQHNKFAVFTHLNPDGDALEALMRLHKH